MKTLLLFCSFIVISCISYATGDNSCSTCSFVGTVVDAATGKPVCNVVIVAKGAGLDSEQKAVTDEQGQYKLPTLPSGTYTLRFEKNHYKSVEKRNLVVKKDPAKLNVELLMRDEQAEDYHNWLLKIDFL